MKADWIKRNLVAVLFVVVFLGLLGYIVLHLRQAVANRRQVVAELKTQRDQFVKLSAEKPYPSSDNLNILRSSRTQLDQLYTELRGSLRRPVAVPPHTQEELSYVLAQKLTEMTGKVRQAGVDTPLQFAFGFDSYLGELPPSQPDALRLLTKELVVIENLVDLLLASNVEQISALRRVPVAGRSGPDTLDGEVRVSPKNLFQTTPFDLKFVGSAKALQTFLNRLSQMPWFFVVRNVAIEVDSIRLAAPTTPTAPRSGSSRRGPTPALTPPAPDGLPPPGMIVPGLPPRPGGPGVALPPGPGVAAILGAPTAPPTPATGDETPAPTAAEEPESSIRNRLTVTMQLDLVEFTEPPKQPKPVKPEKPAKR